jgi:hypothetical protein
VGTIEVDERKVMRFYQNHNVGTVIIDLCFVAATVVLSAAMCGKAYDHVIPHHPLILLPSARLTFLIPNNQADALIRLFNSSITNPVFRPARWNDFPARVGRRSPLRPSPPPVG